MIHLPILRHVRRLIASAIIFGSTVMLMLWLPIRILKMVWPKFLPYTLSGDSEVNELSLQLLLLQIILPGFFEQSHTRVWLKGLLRIWCIAVSWLLGIRSYLLGTEQQTTEGEEQPAAAAFEEPAYEVAQEQPQAEEQHEQNVPLLDQAEEIEDEEQVDAADAPAPAPPVMPVGANAEEVPQPRDVPVGFQPYIRPNFFAVRLLGLMMFVCVSLIIASLITLTVPVWIGRQVMALWSVGGLITNANPVAQHLVGTPDVSPRPHELYTAALGTYLCWVFSRAIAIAVALLPLGRAAILDKLKQWIRVAASYTLPVLIFICLLSIIPLLFGLLLELVVVIPLRVSWYQTPVHFLWQSWALGVLYTKISIALTLMGPDWHMKRALERAYRDGLRDIDLKFLIKDLAAPVVISLGSALAVPYILAHTIIPLFVQDKMTLHNISRIVYPLCFLLLVVIAYIYFEIHQFKKLYVSIKVNKYLVGQRLVNYVDSKRKQEAEAARAAAAAKVAAALGVPKDEEGATGVAFETIKEPPPAEPVINTVELEMLEQKRRDENALIYRPQLEQVGEMAFGNELL